MRPATPSPFDQDKLRLIREFLHREFRNFEHEDYFHAAEMAQVFVMETSRGLERTLIIPKDTFEHPDFTLLFDARFAETLQSAGDIPLTLTADGAM